MGVGPAATQEEDLAIDQTRARVAADTAYQNAMQNSDLQNARIEHDKALGRVMTAVLKDDTELFKQFMDNESFRHCESTQAEACATEIRTRMVEAHRLKPVLRRSERGWWKHTG